MDTPVTLTTALRYPIRIVAQLVEAGASVTHGQPLFSFTEDPPPSAGPSDAKGKGRASSADVRTFLSPLEGALASWAVAPGAAVRDTKCVTASGVRTDHCRQTVLSISEPCLHPIQLGGLCGVCGKDLTVYVVAAGGS